MASQAADPTASILSFQMQYRMEASYHNIDSDSGGTFTLRPVIPYKLFDQPHISRITVPFPTHGPDLDALEGADIAELPPGERVPTSNQGGIGDTVWLDVFIFPFSLGRWGVGPVVVFPTASDEALGSEKWQAGPATVVIANKDNLQYGFLQQWFLSFAGEDNRKDINLLALQPFTNYNLGEGWGVGNSDMSFNYDFEGGRWSSLPLGLRVSKLVDFGSRPMRTYIDVEYNFADDAIAPEWTVVFQVAPLFTL
jgi:hypothetical protein